MRKRSSPNFRRIEKISAVCPAYRCRDCLHTLPELAETAFSNSELDWEFILFDERAPDQPWIIKRDLTKSNLRAQRVGLSRNHGQIWAELEAVTGDYVAEIDCDIQDDPNYIPILHSEFKRQAAGAMIVNRGSWSDSLIRRFFARCFYAIVKFLRGVKIGNIGNFDLYSHRLLTLSKMIIARFTDRLPKLRIIAGLIFSSFPALISTCLFVMWLLDAFTVPGWANTILPLWFLFGVIMTSLGIPSFHLRCVFRETHRRSRILLSKLPTKEIHPFNSAG